MNQLTAILHRGEPDEGGFWATKQECLNNLAEAVKLLLESEREEVFRLDPQAETVELNLARHRVRVG